MTAAPRLQTAHFDTVAGGWKRASWHSGMCREGGSWSLNLWTLQHIRVKPGENKADEALYSNVRSPSPSNLGQLKNRVVGLLDSVTRTGGLEDNGGESHLHS
jgi:hypothetical protein